MAMNVRYFYDFYKTWQGKRIRSSLQNALRPSLKNIQNMVSIGYTAPYIDDKTLFILPNSIEVPNTISNTAYEPLNNAVCADISRLPLESNSVEAILMIHGLEYCDDPDDSLKDIWRTLKSEGYFILVVPNVRGMDTKNSPFKQGRGFSPSQIQRSLSEATFVCEEIQSVLFTPPVQWKWIDKLSPFFEKYGSFLLPTMENVHIVIARKQVYAPIKPSSGKAMPAKSILNPELNPLPCKNSHKSSTNKYKG